MRMIDADALFAVVQRHHDLYKGATNPTDKARRDECLQIMCDINDAPDVDAIPVEWLERRLNETAEATARGADQTELNNAIFQVLVEWEKGRRKNGKAGH